MEFLVLMVVAAVAWYGISEAMRRAGKDGGHMHCMTCGTDALPKRAVKGSFAVEVVLWVLTVGLAFTMSLRLTESLMLWLLLAVPTVVYSLWRITSRHKACPACAGTQLVPLSAPAAIAHKKQLNAGA